MTTIKTLQDQRIGGAVFYPRPDLPFGKIAKGARDLMFDVASGVRLRLRLFRGPEDAPNLLFFHGNGETARDYDPMADAFRELPATFAVGEYRGYGTSTGTPSIYTFLEDAHRTFDEFRKVLVEEGRMGPIIVMGRSLGSAPAIDLALARSEFVSGLIIESGFARLVPLLELIGIPARTFNITEEYGPQNELKMGEIYLPTLFIHAEEDEIIPISDAERLFQACRDRGKTLYRVERAGHNDLHAKAGKKYYTEISSLIARAIEKSTAE